MAWTPHRPSNGLNRPLLELGRACALHCLRLGAVFVACEEARLRRVESALTGRAAGGLQRLLRSFRDAWISKRAARWIAPAQNGTQNLCWRPLSRETSLTIEAGALVGRTAQVRNGGGEQFDRSFGQSRLVTTRDRAEADAARGPWRACYPEGTAFKLWTRGEEVVRCRLTPARPETRGGAIIWCLCVGRTGRSLVVSVQAAGHMRPHKAP